MDALFEYQQTLLANTTLTFFRYKYTELDWERRVFGLVGPRGVGKTTMVLQYIKQHLSLADYGPPVFFRTYIDRGGG